MLNLIFTALCVLPLQEAETSQVARPSLFEDQLQVDSTSKYKIEGDVSWQDGTIAIAKGASLETAIEGGSSFDLRIDFADSQKNETAAFDLTVQFEEATDCIFKVRPDGQNWSVELWDTIWNTTDTELVRKGTLPVPAGKLKLAYHYGLVTLYADDKPGFHAYLENGLATLKAIRLSGVETELGVSRLSANGVPKPEWSDKDQAELDAASKLEEAANQLANKRSDYKAAAVKSSAALKIRKRIQGALHPTYADRLVTHGWIIERGGDKPGGLAHYTQAAGIRRKVMGKLHPEHAECVGYMAWANSRQGKYKVAEPLLLRVREISAHAFGVETMQHVKAVTEQGTLARFAGNHDRAVAFYKEAVEFALRGESNSGAHRFALRELGVYFSLVPDWKESARTFEKLEKLERTKFGEKSANYIRTLVDLANCHQGLKEYTSAETCHKRVLELQEQLSTKDSKAYSQAVAKYARFAKTKGDLKLSASLYRRAVDIQSGLKDVSKSELAGTYRSLGHALLAAKDWKSCGEAYQRALDLLVETHGPSHKDVAAATDSLGILEFRQGNYQKAVDLYESSVAMRKKLFGEKYRDLGKDLTAIVYVYDQLGKKRKVIEMCGEIEAIQKGTFGEESLEHAQAIHKTGVYYHHQGSLLEAERYYKRAAAIRKKIAPKSEDYAESVSALAVLNDWSGRPNDSERLYLDGIKSAIEKHGESSKPVAKLQYNLAHLLYGQRNFARAKKYLEPALATRRKLLPADSPILARTLILAGDIALSTAPSKCLDYYREAYDNLKDVDSKGDEYASSLGRLGDYYQTIRNFPRAIVWLTRLSEFYKENKGSTHRDYSISLKRLARLYRTAGQSGRATTMFERIAKLEEESLGKDHVGRIGTLNTLAKLYLDARNNRQADEVLVECKRIVRDSLGADHPEYRTVISNYAWLQYSTGQFTKAEEACEEMATLEAEKLYRVGFVASPEVQPLLLSRVREKLDLWCSTLVEAERSDADLISAVWSLEPASLFLNKVTKDINNDGALSENVTAMREAIVDGDNAANQVRLAAIRTNITEAIRNKEMDGWREKWRQANVRQQELNAQIARATDWGDKFTQRIDVEAIQEKLAKDTALVQFHLYQHSPRKSEISLPKVAAFVIRKDKVGLVSVGYEMNFLWKPEDSAFLLSGQKRSDGEQAMSVGEMLFESVWKPLTPHLRGVKTIVTMSNTIVSGIPLAAIQPGDGSCLAEHYQFVSVPSVSVLNAVLSGSKRKWNHDGSVLAVGNIDYGAAAEDPEPEETDPLAALLGVKSLRRQQQKRDWRIPSGFLKDVKMLRKQMTSVTTRTSDRATESQLLGELDTHATLYFSSHTGLSRDRSPGLILAGANSAKGTDPSADGILSGSELWEQKLSNVDLVVLPIAAHEAKRQLNELASSFCHAGVRVVLATAWETSDDSRREFLKRFFAAYRDGQTPAEAFRTVQLELLAEAGKTNPINSDWAAFQFVGDWR